MNTKELLKVLSRQFSDYVCHLSFLEELYNILRKELSGKEKQLFKQLEVQLENISKMGRMVHMADHNERLKGKGKGYYSLHLSGSQYNVRLLVYVSVNGKPYFLSAFFERGGKKRTDYSSHIAVLERRLEQLLGDEQNE